LADVRSVGGGAAGNRHVPRPVDRARVEGAGAAEVQAAGAVIDDRGGVERSTADVGVAGAAGRHAEKDRPDDVEVSAAQVQRSSAAIAATSARRSRPADKLRPEARLLAQDDPPAALTTPPVMPS
jgi:hypothetical protein